MANRGRPRKRRDDYRLPPYVYLKWNGFVHVAYLGKGKLGKETFLAVEGTPVGQVWTAYNALVGDQDPGTLRWLCDEYLKSDQHQEKKQGTRDDYEKSHAKLINAKLKNGTVLGEVAYRKITPGILRRYVDWRAKTARVRANRELSFLSIVFAWAYERDLITTNPAIGVKKTHEPPRTRYIEDWEYQHLYDLAAQFPYYLRPAMEFAYLMRLRQSEVLDLRHSDITDQGIAARRKKGSKQQIIEWSDRLRQAVAMSSSPSTIQSFYLLHDQRGQPVKQSTFQSAWNRLMAIALDKGLQERFTFHDLKAKGITDFDGDKQKAAGHKSPRMADLYNRKPEKVPSTK